jgi:parallel beta-helix repeat protein
MPPLLSPTIGAATISRAVSIFLKALLLAALATVTLSACGARAETVNCDKVAATNGSDSAAGTADAPYRTAQKLSDSLLAGQTGCLHAGTYDEDLRVGHGGRDGAPVTIRSYPGERARLLGRLWIARGADYVTIAALDLNGVNPEYNLPSPTVNSSHATFVDNDVTNEHHAICFNLGNSSYGRAINTVIERNRIHDCGVLPAANHDHGIYVAEADDTKIIGNLIYDNADRGIQLYPNAQRTVIQGNVIDGNGEGIIFSGDGGETSSYNDVEFNVITNSNLRNNVESWYPSGNPIGTGNVVTSNCISGGVRDTGNGGIGEQIGFKATANLLDPVQYANRAAKDFTLPAGSQCAALLARGQGDVTTSTPPVVSPPPTNSGSTSGSGKGHVRKRTSMKVTFRGRAKRHGKVRVGGSVKAGLHAASATAHQRVTIQLRRRGAWYPLASLKVRGEAFRSTLKLPRYLRGRTFTLRAMAPTVGTSKHLRLRAS